MKRLPSDPHLARAVPQLHAEELHRLILDRGLEASGDLIALATPTQIAAVFDLDLWRPARAGGDEVFDAGRFGAWLEVLVAGGASAAAATLAAQDPALVTVALTQYVRVIDRAVVDPYISLDGDLTPTGYTFGGGPRCDVGGCVLLGRRSDAWEAITAVLIALEAEHGDYFARLMRGCARLSDVGREADGLDDLLERDEQWLFDLAIDREDRREAQGYVAPARARVFLDSARRRPSAPNDAAPAAGLLPALRDADPLTTVNERLAFLANALIAGTSMQGRPLQREEVPAAVAAVCTLGRERSVTADLISAFQAGWLRLHEEVCTYTADRLLADLAGLPRYDDDTNAALRTLRAVLAKHVRSGTPWRARDALDVLASLDLPTWAGLRGVIDEFPVLPAAVRACMTAHTSSVSATAFEFISSTAQVRLIQAFADSLGERLGGGRPLDDSRAVG